MADRLYGDVVADATGISVALSLRSSVDNPRLTGVAAGPGPRPFYRPGPAGPQPAPGGGNRSANDNPVNIAGP